jgi:hypothetical protein
MASNVAYAAPQKPKILRKPVIEKNFWEGAGSSTEKKKQVCWKALNTCYNAIRDTRWRQKYVLPNQKYADALDRNRCAKTYNECMDKAEGK